MQEVMEPILQIQVLGKFTLRYGETVISDEDDRSRKVWAVLAYLIYHREKIISQQELVDLCWGEDTRSSDPHNALKSVIHRIRATLDKLDELRALYRKATRTVNNHALSVEDLREQLREEHVVGGAMLCTYDFFKILYRSETRTMARTGNTAHLCLLTVAAKDGSELPKRSLDRAMENLQELIRQNLRKGDVASQCSVSQYVILLPRANYENSHMVANRLMTAFYRRYPHSPARLRCVVQPLEPVE